MRRFYKLALASLLLLAGCAGSGLFAGEPSGKQLERALKQIEEQCRAAGAPPFGPNRPGHFETACLMFTLKSWEPGDTPESAFAHSIKLPPPHDKPKEVYKPGMSSEEYFNALCNAEAGEWILRTVEGVRGIRQERPNRLAHPGESGIVFYARERVLAPIYEPKEIFEERTRNVWQYIERRIRASDQKKKLGDYEYFDAANREGRIVATPSSNYAYMSRGIRRVFDRENAIDGMEFIVYQVDPFELVGIQRVFFRYYLTSRTKDPRMPEALGCPKAFNSYEFLRDVLRPFESK